jgi:NAD(P)-dependent dehydrogenase (short-subunit alcohol dehydrogenase family)
VLESLADRVAVVTGGASGIGRALAEAFLGEGMKVVIADIEAAAVENTVAELESLGEVEVEGVVTDVTDVASVQALADRTLARFGAVHLLCNNAGVGPPAEPHLWDNTPNDWRWTFSVNVLGVAHGISVFLPVMLASGQPGHVVNTSSPDGGIVAMANAGVYAASKAAVVTLTECLHAQLEEMNAPVGASVLLPAGLLRTGLWTADRNRPAELTRERPRSRPGMSVDQFEQVMRQRGTELRFQPLDEVARWVVDGVQAGQFWILPPGLYDDEVRQRAEAIIDRRRPYVHKVAL